MGADSVFKLSSSGTLLKAWGGAGNGDGQFDSPHSLVLNSKGEIYISDYLNHRIQKFSSSGTFLAKWGSQGTGDGQFSYPRGLAIDSLDNVYVCDYSNYRIQIFTPAGEFITKFGRNGTGDGMFTGPHGIVIDKRGRVFVSDDRGERIQVFNPPSAPPTVTNKSICVGENLALSSLVQGQLIKWYSTATTAVTMAEPPAPSAVGTYTYFVTNTSNSCESKRLPVTVTVTRPAPPAIVSNSINYCQYSNATSVANNLSNPNNTPIWYSGATGTAIQTSLVPSTQNVETFNYYVSQKLANGCESERSTFAVKINPTARLKVTDIVLNTSNTADITKAFIDSNNTVGTVTYARDINFLEKLTLSEAQSISTPGTYYIQKVTGTCSTTASIKVTSATRANQTISFPTIVPKTMGDLPFDLNATSSQGLPISYTSSDPTIASISGKTVTIKNSGTVTITASQAGNATVNPASNVSQVLVINKATTTGPIVSKTFPTTLPADANFGITVTLKVESPNTYEVMFFYKKITEDKWVSEKVSSNSFAYAPILTGKIGEIGMRYYFTIKSGTVLFTSDTGLVHVEYTNGLALPKIEGGSKLENYQIVSFPLELSAKKVGEVLDELGPMKKSQWRLFHYNTQDTVNVELGINDTISPGLGYWLISRNPVSINTGKGTAVKVSDTDPFKIQLKKGYNQIGNPYNFPILWSDVILFNGVPEGVKNKGYLYTKSGWIEATTLKSFEGGYVWSDKDIEIKIPTLKPISSSARLNTREDVESWIIDLSVSDESGFLGRGGFGMRADASAGKDGFDEITLPRFMKYQEINFHHPEYFAPKFSYDVVPPSANNQWRFSVESNTVESSKVLKWDASACKAHSENLYLFDKKAGIKINMKEQESYSLPGAYRELAIYFGNNEFIESSFDGLENVVSDPFPNPFSESTTIAYSLARSSDDYKVEVSIYNMIMEEVVVLENSLKKAGINITEWNGKDAAGQKVPGGLYFVRIKAASGVFSKEWLKKVVVQ